MRIRLTDGTHEVEIRSKGYSRRKLDDAEASALRMLDALRATGPTNAGTQFGFTADHTLDGVSLDSATERADPPHEAGCDDDGEDGQA